MGASQGKINKMAVTKQIESVQHLAVSAPFHHADIHTHTRLQTCTCREFEINMNTLLYLKWITNKALLCSTENSAQCYMADRMGGEFGGEWIHVYV